MKTAWTKSEIKFLNSFKNPWDIQSYLDSLRYNDEYCTCSPKLVLARQKAHCAEGAYLAAAILRQMGYLPRVIDLKAVNDDDHLVTVYQYGKEKLWGSIAKSNTTVLRDRDPVYKTLRELVMSYFPFYFNTLGEKSLVSFSKPLNLSRFDRKDWETTDEDLDYIGQYIDQMPHLVIVSQTQKKKLPLASKAIIDACFMGSVTTGLYKPT